jgi:hypothetical protein
MLTQVQSGNHVVMGHNEDPEDGGAVAGAVFGAVFIYIVCQSAPVNTYHTHELLGILRLLRIPSSPPHQRKPPRRDKPIIADPHPHTHSSFAYRFRSPAKGSVPGTSVSGVSITFPCKLSLYLEIELKASLSNLLARNKGVRHGLRELYNCVEFLSSRDIYLLFCI